MIYPQLKKFTLSERENLKHLIDNKHYKLGFQLMRAKYSLLDVKFYMYMELRWPFCKEYKTSDNAGNEAIFALSEFEEWGMLRIIRNHKDFEQLWKKYS